MSAHHQLCNEVQHTEHIHHEVTRSRQVEKKNYSYEIQITITKYKI